ncbi:MAG: ABC transporter permease [Acidimicrobiaceae bacterium]|nr:ABC transporter permease [Acidimicrobiaceae bacterium]MDE0657292.1 ABC transporter permease [Acidimicrobiaceae bacterium]
MAEQLPSRPGYQHRGAGRLADRRSMAGQPLETPGDEIAPHWRTVWRRFRRHRLAVASLAVFTLIALCAVLADWVAPYGATEQNLDRILAPPGRDFLLGTDTLGRDTLSRILYGGRISLLVGVSVALISGVVGTAVGLVAGYCRGWVDSALMRFTDTMLALPSLMVVIMAARILGDSVLDVVIVLAAVSWMVPARIVRAKVLSLCENQFVEAAISLGVPGRRIMVRDLLPNLVGEIVVAVSLTVAGAILAESTLSFLGLGVSAAHTATWGNMLGGNEGFMITAPWLVWAPGLAIVATVLCINFIGDGLRDALDPPRR